MRTLLFSLIMAAPQIVMSQIYIADTNALYFEDFNRLDSFGTGAVAFPPGWEFREWGSAANASYRAGTGSAATSDTYSFGLTRSRERALGSIASGTLPRIVYGVTFVNQSGADINGMHIAYRGEQWRRGGSATADSLRFSFTTVRGSRVRDSARTNWTEVPALHFSSVSTASGTATLNGNDFAAQHQADIPLMLHPGDSLLIRWSDDNAAGNDDGLAIDSLSIRFRNGDVLNGDHPELIRFSPDSSAGGLPADPELHLGFDREVRAGGGNIYVENLDRTEIIPVPATSAAVIVSGRDVRVTGLQLRPGDRYRVRFDSAAFDSLGFVSRGLFGQRWHFWISPVSVALSSPGGMPITMNAVADGRVFIRASPPEYGTWMLEAYDLAGRRVLGIPVSIRQAATIVNPELPPGICYLLVLRRQRTVLRTGFCKP